MPKVNHPLTPKQKAFCREYAVCGNASEACRRAGFSKKNADTLGGQLLRKPWVMAEIQRLAKVAEDKALLTIEEADKILAEIVRFDQSDYEELLPDGDIVHSFDKSKPNRRAVKTVFRKMYSTGSGDGKMDVTVAGIIPYDKEKALDIFYKRKGAYTQKVEMTGPGGGPVVFVHAPAPIATIEEWEKQCREADKLNHKKMP